MRDGLLFGLALFFAFGTFMFGQGAYFQYTEVCRGNLDLNTKLVLCDPVIFFEAMLYFGICAVVTSSLFIVWWSGRKFTEALG